MGRQRGITKPKNDKLNRRASLIYADMLQRNHKDDLHRGNYFAGLMDFDPETTQENNDTPVERQKKPPPVIVDSNHEFQKVLKDIGTDGYSFKRTSIGTKIFSDYMEKYTALTKSVNSKGYSYHTHKVKDNNIFKMVLFGLHRIPCDHISDELSSNHGVKTVDVREIVTRRSTDNDTLYLITFKRSEVRKKLLHKIRFINKVAIYWRNQYTKPKDGPTQCVNCGMYGHASENCHRKIVCFLCSSTDHQSSSCSLNNNSEGKQFKCFNCVARKYTNINHRADDPQCRSRKDYLETRRKLVNKNYQRQAPQSNTAPNYVRAEDDYPRLINDRNIPFQASNSRPTYADQVRNNNSNGADLFTHEELFDIFRKASTELKRCTSKLDQLYVLLKYAM